MANRGVRGLPGSRWIWATLAVVLILGLFTWLTAERQRYLDEVALREQVEEREGETEEELEIEWADLDGIAASPGEFVGERRLRVENVQVAAPLGPRAFWAMTPDGGMVLVLVGEDLSDPPPVIDEGTTLHLEGYVGEVTEDEIEEWQVDGIIDPRAVDQLAIATHYLWGTGLFTPEENGAAAPEDGDDDGAENDEEE